jgi:hypothetical protein
MLLIVTAAASNAQTGPGVPGLEIFYSKPEPLAAALERMKTDPRPTSTEGAVQFLDWLLYASAGWGGSYDSNVNATAINPQRVYGAEFRPSLVAEHNTGIQRTFLYLNGDVVYYPSIRRTNLNGTKGGLVHVWEIQRDLIFRIQTQVAEVQAGSSFNNFLTTGVYATTPVNYTQAFGSSSIQKEFGWFFTAIGGSITATKYQNTVDNFGNVIDEQFQNGTVSTANYRLGVRLGPIIYTYVEPSGTWTHYQASNLDSRGYRVVGGIGSDLISLFRGEIYGGYLSQRFNDPTIGVVDSPVAGGRLSWYPTRFLTFTVSGDQTFGTTDFNALAFTPGSPTKITTVDAKANWDFSRLFALSVGFNDQRLNYLNSFRRDDFAAFKAGIIYKVRPGFGIELGYTHQHLYSNFPGAPYSRDFVGVSGNTTF